MIRRLIPTVLMCAAVAVPPTTWGATTPADAIKYRNAVMAALGAHMSAFTLVNFGKVEHQAHLKDHADAIAALAKQTRVLFPAGSDSGDTRALPLIWKEQEEFNKLVTRLETSAGKLSAAVAANDKAGTMGAFKELGESCKGCHDRYRKAAD